MAAAAVLDFQFMSIWPLLRVGSVVFVFCTEFGSLSVIDTEIDAHYTLALHLMTSRKLTSGFYF